LENALFKTKNAFLLILYTALKCRPAVRHFNL
jgi:hypothetical protein